MIYSFPIRLKIENLVLYEKWQKMTCQSRKYVKYLLTFTFYQNPSCYTFYIKQQDTLRWDTLFWELSMEGENVANSAPHSSAQEYASIALYHSVKSSVSLLCVTITLQELTLMEFLFYVSYVKDRTPINLDKKNLIQEQFINVKQKFQPFVGLIF